MTAAKPVVTTRVVAAANGHQARSGAGGRRPDHDGDSGDASQGRDSEAGGVIGRGVISHLYQGEPILESRLARRLRRGTGVNHSPGHESLRGEGGSGGGRGRIRDSGHARGCSCFGQSSRCVRQLQGTVTKTILQNIQVLSAGTDIQKDAEGKPQQVQVVNLLVTPEQAQTLSLASKRVEDSTGAAQSAGYKSRSG